jgi:zinc protease
VVSLRSRQAYEYFFHHYRPENLIVALVGDVDPRLAHDLAQRYFGRLRSQSEEPDGAPRERAESARGGRPLGAPAEPGANSVLLEESCACRPRVLVRWPGAAAGSAEEVVLDLLAGVLNGRSGRLLRGLVEGKRSAFAAFATHASRAQAGSFTLTAEALEPEAAPTQVPLAELRQQLLAELESLAHRAVPEDELHAVRRRLAREHAEQIEASQGLLLQLLARHTVGASERVWRRREQLEEVTGEDLRRAARALLDQPPSVLLLEREPPRAAP